MDMFSHESSLRGADSLSTFSPLSRLTERRAVKRTPKPDAAARFASGFRPLLRGR
jgi:hypothetical protein